MEEEQRKWKEKKQEKLKKKNRINKQMEEKLEKVYGRKAKYSKRKGKII